MTGRNSRSGVSRRIGPMLGVVALTAMTMVPVHSIAQRSRETEPAASRALIPVPTTKLLAIGSFTAKAKPADWQKVLPDEARATVQLYLDGKIDQWFVKQDQSGVVFLLNVTDPAEAKALLEKLPFGPAGLMEFQFIPLGPISPLRILLTDPHH